ncbi:protein argonaute 1 [Ceratobasidium sp. AG-Ba]|nr:protein argonaute 1 [Ceratobasidium sp. AG-Ba]
MPPRLLDVPTIGVKRPGFGTSGRSVTVLVNHFVCSKPTGTVYHYDDIDKGSFDGRLNTEIMERLQQLEPNLFHPKGAFDGKKNMFTSSLLDLGDEQARTFEIPIENSPYQNPRLPNVTIRLVGEEINLEVLHQFQQGRHEQDNSVLTALTALNVALRHAPISLYTFNARAFFPPTNERRSVPMGLELWPGVFQSIRPAINSMHINIDTTTGVIFKPGPVIDHALALLDRRHPADLSNLSARDFRTLETRLKKLKVTLTYLQDSEPRAIMGLTRTSASTTMFERDGQQISVAQYFQQVHGRTLRFPNLPCVDVKRRHNVPMEFCNILPGQLMRKIPEELTDQMNPAQRLTAIRESFDSLHYNSSVVTQFGITVNSTPVQCPARVLQPPVIEYSKPVNPKNGAWNLRNEKLKGPVEIKGWMLVIFEREKFFDEAAVQHTIDRFKQACQEKGIKGASSQLLVERVSGQSDVRKTLGDLGNRFRRQYGILPDLIITIMPKHSGDLHHNIKQFGDVLAGVATQPLKAEKCRKGNLQYFGNVCLKINLKLGGTNSTIQSDLGSNFLGDVANPTLILGADVSHPAAHTEGRPSFSALVGSMDLKASKYVATHRMQRSRMEGILDLEEMAIYIIKSFQTYQKFKEGNKTPGPQRILFYRDGVAEGQFKYILQYEYEALKRACKKCGLDPMPKITLVVVGKRHHTRMFPQNPKDRQQADEKSENCLAGTVIDSDITHPLEFDFFLLSHGGLIGTSRPAHYSVIRDDNNFTADSMERLTYALCHTYARATRSVSIPAPVYYADLVCGRARNHLPPGVELEFDDDAKNLTEEQKEAHLRRIRSLYKPTHQNLERNM